MGSADSSKLLRFEVDGFTAATTRVMTPPNSDGTLAILGIAQTWSGLQTYSTGLLVQTDTNVALGSGVNAVLQYDSANTPDTLLIGVPGTSNAVIVEQVADTTSDRAIPLQAEPTLFLVPSTAPETTQRLGIAYYGSQGRAIKALTESAATSVLQVPVAASTGVGGTITFTAFAADATDQQTLTGVLQYAAVNKAGTETCATPTLTGTALNSVSTGTLTCTYACDTSPANAVNIQFNCASSLTQTTLDLYYRVDALGASEPLPQ
jgi:hypothetical protein